MARRRLAIGVAAVVAVALVGLSSCGFAGAWPADQITDHGARLSGNIGNTTIGPTSYHFEYGTTDAYGSSTPVGTVEVTDVHVPVGVSSDVEGLAEGTTYHYRLCASDAVGGVGGCSADATFTTTSGHDYVLGHGSVNAFGFGPHGGQIDVTGAHDGSDPDGSLSGYEAVFGPFHPQYVSAAITCLRVEGNRATVGATVYYPGLPDALPLLVYVEDGASTGTPDKWATTWLAGTAPTTCPVPNESDFPPLVVVPPSPPYPPGTIVTIPHEIDPSDGGDVVVHDSP